MPTFRSYLLPVLALLAFSCHKEPEYDRFGGYTDIQLEATGHFRTQKINGRWAFVTPEGHPYVAIGANHVGKFLEDNEQSKPFLERFGGNREVAEEAMHKAILGMGLNAGEAYEPLLTSLKRRMPYVVNIDFPAQNKFQFDVFDPIFQKALEEKIKESCRNIKKDSMVLGIAFADLPIWDYRRMDFYRSLPKDAIGKQQYQFFLQKKYGSIEILNNAYETEFGSFAKIDSVNVEYPAVVKDDKEFLGILADTLYANLQRAVRKYAPEKLFFGERFVLRMVPQSVLESVGKYVDVFCTQALILSPQRPPEWQIFQKEAYEEQFESTYQKPMMIIDWAAPFSLDSTYKTERGTVKNERQASNETAQWLQEVFSLPYIIGVFKCQLIGAHPNDSWFPKGRMKRTYLQDDGRPFPIRTEITKKAHETVLSSVYESLQAE